MNRECGSILKLTKYRIPLGFLTYVFFIPFASLQNTLLHLTHASPLILDSSDINYNNQPIIHKTSKNTSSLNHLPRPLVAALALLCLLVAAIVAGLTLGLMSLDTVGLEIVMNSSSSRGDAEAARKIKPIRQKGNLLLVVLLLTNTIAMEVLPLLLEMLFPGGLIALIASVVLILIFGEILPQALFSKHALQIGAFFIPFVKVLIFVLWPVAYPIAKLLDLVLGDEPAKVYSNDELKELLAAHQGEMKGQLTLDETHILRGTLEMGQKTVADIMTPEDKVFMLSVDQVLDAKALRLILAKGHSRVPLYLNHRANVVALLLVKQLILLDPEDEVPVRKLIRKKKKVNKLKVAPPLCVSASTPLSDMLNEFQFGRSHMGIIYDDISKKREERLFLGIITLEDIIEQILQEEIFDETDIRLAANVPVLHRQPDGTVVRTAVQPALVTTKRVKGTKSILVRDIDVVEIKRKMLEQLSFQDLSETISSSTSGQIIGDKSPITPRVSVQQLKLTVPTKLSKSINTSTRNDPQLQQVLVAPETQPLLPEP